MNQELEEREYYEAWLVAKDHGYPHDFNEFVKDFTNMINIAKYEDSDGN